MNLKGIYEVFYPGNKSRTSSVWVEKPKYRSQKEFFEELVPMEIRWLNSKIWNDKTRRSRFFSDSKKEARYLVILKEYLLEHPWTIPRMEKRANDLLSGKISETIMNEIFFQNVESEEIELSKNLMDYLVDEETGKLKTDWGNVLTFFFYYAIFPTEVNQIYGKYLYQKKNQLSIAVAENGENKKKKDDSLFQYEYPPDMGVYYPEEMIEHTWIIKNVGEIAWEDRYYECITPPFELGEENRKINITDIVYPGDMISPSVRFKAPKEPGVYILNWKMKDKYGNLVYLDKLGLGLHFTVLEDRVLNDEGNIEKNNYKVLEEIPPIPATVVAGKLYSHVWHIQNTGEEIWKDFYLECINMESFHYAKSELRIMLKERIMPGEKITVKVEFVTPPVEGVYRLIWRFMKKDGIPAFPKGRQLEVLLNLI